MGARDRRPGGGEPLPQLLAGRPHGCLSVQFDSHSDWNRREDQRHAPCRDLLRLRNAAQLAHPAAPRVDLISPRRRPTLPSPSLLLSPPTSPPIAFQKRVANIENT